MAWGVTGMLRDPKTLWLVFTLTVGTVATLTSIFINGVKHVMPEGRSETGNGFSALSQKNKGDDKRKFDRLGRVATFEKGETSMGRMLELHKALWLPFSIGCILFFDNWSMRPSLMSGLFGAYGVVWVIKSNIYPDLQFYNSDKAKIKGSADYIAKFMLIGVYFLYPIIAASSEEQPHALEIMLPSFTFCLGGFFHWAGDAQRYYQLKHDPGRLITDGFFAHVRHPSYTGEILMWLSLTFLAGPLNLFSWIPVVWLLLVTVLLGIPEKEKSLSRYKEFAQWKNDVPALVPRLFVPPP